MAQQPTNIVDPVAPRRRALLLLLDGCRPDALLAAEAPNLKRLAFRGGAFSFHVDCGGVPLSAPCWATILSGAPQEQHQVSTNDLNAQLSLDDDGRVLVSPMLDCACSAARRPSCQVFRFCRDFAAPAGPRPLPPTLFSRLACAGRSAALFTVGTWDGVGRLCGAPAGMTHASLEGGRLVVKHFASDLEGELQASKEAVDVALEAVNATEAGSGACPDVVAVYLHLIDGTGHAMGFGGDVVEYADAIRDVDVELGRLLHALESRATEDWLVAVTTDHGGTAQARMPRKMRDAFAECGCVQKGIKQTDLKGVHGLRELPQHRQTFQILACASNLESGEMLPSPGPEDFAPTVLQHILGTVPVELPGMVRAMLPTVPEVPGRKRSFEEI